MARRISASGSGDLKSLKVIPAPLDPDGPALILHLVPKPLMDGYIKLYVKSAEDLYKLADRIASQADVLFPTKQKRSR